MIYEKNGAFPPLQKSKCWCFYGCSLRKMFETMNDGNLCYGYTFVLVLMKEAYFQDHRGVGRRKEMAVMFFPFLNANQGSKLLFSV